MDIDSAMQKIGGFGPAQVKIVFLANLAHIISGFHALLYSFIAADPGWFCAVDNKDGLKRCELVQTGNCEPSYHTHNFTSIVSEWDLICSKHSFPNLSQSAFFVGSLLGAWIWGGVTDRIGRRKVFFITAACVAVTGLGYGLAYNYLMFVIFRVLSAISGAGFILSSYVLSVEVVGISARSFAGILGSVLFGLSYLFVTIAAYFIRSWRALTIVLSVIGIGIFGTFRIIPESPRWLLVNGYTAEARAVLEEIARGNGTVLPQEELRKPDTSSSDSSLGIRSLLSGEVARKRTLILFAAWFSECMAYYALAMRSGDLGSNRYTSFALSGFVELPAMYLAYKMLDRIGRRWTHGGFLLFSGISCLSWSITYWIGADYLGAPVALLGKFSLTGAFGVAYLYTAELFPTQVRNQALGVASIGARLGGILSPIVIMTDGLNKGLPMLILGSLAAVTGLLSLSLPETLNQPLPNTLRELEQNV